MVATPLGNLEDLTARALRILREADAIVSEDTRTTMRLLAPHEIRKPLIAYFQDSPPRRLEEILERLRRGDKIALVSEAGTPGVSDPGARLVDAALAEKLPVSPVPGPSAVAAAASVCGFPVDAFHFGGFLPRKPGKRRKALRALADLDITLIFYESPHRIAACLEDMLAELGDRRMTLCREITKMHEEIRRMPLSEAVARFRTQEALGEFTVAVEGKPKASSDPEPDEP